VFFLSFGGGGGGGGAPGGDLLSLQLRLLSLLFFLSAAHQNVNRRDISEWAN
jgi:hypothetical protein